MAEKLINDLSEKLSQLATNGNFREEDLDSFLANTTERRVEEDNGISDSDIDHKILMPISETVNISKIKNETDSQFLQPNVIGELQETCQKLCMGLEFNEAKVEGPPHQRRFTYEAKIGGINFFQHYELFVFILVLKQFVYRYRQHRRSWKE